MTTRSIFSSTLASLLIALSTGTAVAQSEASQPARLDQSLEARANIGTRVRIKPLEEERIRYERGLTQEEYATKIQDYILQNNPNVVPRHAVGWERAYAFASLDRVGQSVGHGFREGFDSLPSPKG